MAGANKAVPHAWPVARSISLCVIILVVSGLLVRRVSPPRTFVSITFDDGYADQYTAEPILLRHGMQGTFYIITSKVDQPGYLTWQQLATLQADGNEIGGHTITHPNLLTLQGYALRHEICDSRVELMQHGFRITSFAYTYGTFDRTTEQVVGECGYNSGRSVNGRQEAIPPRDPYNLRAMDPVDAKTTLTALRNMVKQTERAGGGWVDLLFHHVCDNCDTYSISPQEFSSFLDWLRLREPDGTVVRTVDAIMGGVEQPPVSAAGQ